MHAGRALRGGGGEDQPADESRPDQRDLLGDDASLGMLRHKLSELPVVTIAKVRGRARGAGSELALACDMRFAAIENAVFEQIEAGVGALPGTGGVQTRGPLELDLGDRLGTL